MLVVNSSGYKTGGTWLYNIIKAGSKIKFISNLNDVDIDHDDDYFTDIGVICAQSDLINVAKLANSSASDGVDRLLKLHFYSSSDAAVKYFSEVDAKFIYVVRDYKDIIVSRFYHESISRFEGGFDDFFKIRARNFLKEAIAYNRFWDRLLDTAGRAQVMKLNFEDLKHDFDMQLLKIEGFLGDDYFDIENAKEMYSIEINREKNSAIWMEVFEEKGSSFYRKGEVGDYKKHFSEDQEILFSQWINEIKNEVN